MDNNIEDGKTEEQSKKDPPKKIKKKKDNKNTTYGYYRVSTPDFEPQSYSRLDDYKYGKIPVYGYVCVRLDRPAKELEGVGPYKASFSFCSPHDRNKFSKKIARKIADARMETKRVKAHVTFSWDEKCPKLARVLEAAIQHALDIEDNDDYKIIFPEWFDESNLIAGIRD